MADDALERRTADLQIRAREIERRYRTGTARFRLRNVSASDFADRETITGRLEFAGQNIDVVFTQAKNGLVADHIHEGGHAVEQHALLYVAQRLAACPDRRLRLD